MYIYSKNSLWKHIDFVVLDVVVMAVSYVAAYYIRHGNLQFSELYYQIAAALFFAFLCWVALMAPYQGILRRGMAKEMWNVFCMDTMFLGLSTCALFFVKHSEAFSRSVLFYFLLLDGTLTWTLRTILKRYLAIRYRNDKGRKWMVLTSEEESQKILDQYYYQQQGDVEIVSLALLGKDENPQQPGSGAAQSEHVENSQQKPYPVSVLRTEEEMWEYLRTNPVDEVLVGSVTYSDKNTQDILLVMVEMGLTVHLNVGDLPMFLPNQTVHHVGGMTVITGAMKMVDPLQVFLKRAIDIAGSLVGLLITAVLSIFVIPAIKLDSPGPVFFAQNRVGKNGRIFKMYKFRSMYVDAEERKKELMAQNQMEGLMFKMDNDPRITKVGAFIRKTSIDELPQFWNVLKGDMSLVGTRPPTVDEYEQYELLHKRRLSIKPGITGLWQVSGRSAITDFEEVLALDTKYIMEWSIVNDIKLLLKTIVVVLRRKGAV